MRIGLFGGTFNPIHRGHEQAAREIGRSFELDRIYFIPCAVPPHKRHSPLAPAPDRLEMIRRALAGSEQMDVSDVEILRAGPSYTIDTLRYFKKAAAAEHQFFFLLGLDAYLELHTWKAFQQLLDSAALIVMSRPGTGKTDSSLEETIRAYALKYLSDQYEMSEAGDALRHPDMQTIFPAHVTPIDIASSRIRSDIIKGAPIGHWVNPAVAQYMDQKGLYK